MAESQDSIVVVISLALVERIEPEGGQPPNDPRPDRPGTLADPAGEDERVDTRQRRRGGGDGGGRSPVRVEAGKLGRVERFDRAGRSGRGHRSRPLPIGRAGKSGSRNRRLKP